MKKLFRDGVMVLAMLALPLVALADDGLPQQKEYEPKGGTGPAVVMVSGQTGASNYTRIAQALADEGFCVVLVDGNDFGLKGGGAEALLKGVITRAQASAHALPGKVGVVGFSLGGASALVYGTHMPEQVAAVVLHYPATSYITRPAFVVARIKVPTLMMAGTSDTYKNCCLIDTARALAEAAKAGAAPELFELHEYPGAEHGFNTNGSRDRFTAIDSTQRTVAWLKQHMAVDAKAAASAPK